MPDLLKLDAPCYIVGDHHLGVGSREAEFSFLHFLEQIREEAGSLVINGDLFDFWFEWRSVIPTTSFRVLAAISRLVENGVPVLWIGGNHDCWGGKVLKEDVGVHFQLGAWTGPVAGWKVTIEHGDGLRPKGDRGYRALRSIIRNPAAIAAMRFLHPDVGSWIATRSSAASRDHRPREGGDELRGIALAKLAGSAPSDIYVLAHNHVAALERAPGGGIYANAGSWSDGRTHLRITPTAVELLTYSESAGHNRLNLLDRGA